MPSIFHHVFNFFDPVDGFINQLPPLKVYDLGKSLGVPDSKDKSHTIQGPTLMGD
ncbi:MAG: hypothetical protein R6V08_10070 [Desulfuromonadales bacterium]